MLSSFSFNLFGNYIVTQSENNCNIFTKSCNFSFKKCCPYLTTLVSGSPIIKSIRIEKLAYQGECRRLLLGGSILIEYSTKCQGREAHLRRNGV